MTGASRSASPPSPSPPPLSGCPAGSSSGSSSSNSLISVLLPHVGNLLETESALLLLLQACRQQLLADQALASLVGTVKAALSQHTSSLQELVLRLLSSVQLLAAEAATSSPGLELQV